MLGRHARIEMGSLYDEFTVCLPLFIHEGGIDFGKLSQY